MLKLEKMQLSGFKSFSDRTELQFPDGITAVVGPNGCGKSNIGDAINWVLGEQSAKMLRGSSMQDVIFNGSEGRKPVGLAEVSLHLRGVNGDASRGPVVVTRRLFRDGESEYLLNGERSRLKDIQDLLREARVGAKTYATIEQGRIDQILNAKPKDRRLIIEEAAGVSGFKHKRRLAELKLEATQANLLRVQDVIGEVQRQINVLKRQAARARRYGRLREELRGKERVRFAALAAGLDASLQRLAGEEQAGRDAEAAASAALASREAEIAAERASLEDEDRRVREAGAALAALNGAIERKEERLRVCRERVAEAADAAARLAAEAASLDVRGATLASELEERESVVSAGASALAQAEERLAAAQRDLDAANAVCDAARGEAEGARRALLHAVHDLAERRNRVRALEEDRERNTRTEARLREDRTTAEGDVRRLADEGEALARDAEACRARCTSLTEDLAAHEEALRRGKEAEGQARAQASEAREREREARGRRDTLEDVATRFAGVSDGVRILLTATPGRGVLADFVTASPAVEGVADLYLEALLPAVVLDDDVEAGHAVDLLRAEGAGRTAMLCRQQPAGAPAIGSVRNGHTPFPDERLSDARVRGRLRDHLQLDPRASDLMAGRIGDAILVDGLPAALALHREFPGTDYLTPDGDVLYASGVLVSGGRKPTDAGLLAHTRKLHAARADLEAAAAAAALRGAESLEARRGVDEAETALAACRGALEQARHRAVELDLRARQASEERTRTDRRARVLEDELAALAEQRAHLAEEEAAARGLSQEAEARHARAETDVADAAARLEMAEARVREHAESAAALRAELAAHGERQESAVRERDRLREAAAELAARLAADRREEAAARARGDDAQAQIRETEGLLVVELAQRDESRAALSISEEVLDARRRTQAEREAGLRDLRGGHERAREAVRAIELSRISVEGERRHLDALCQQELGMDAAQAAAEAAAAGLPEELPEALEAAIAELRAKIEEIGPVNMMAIDEFGELEERHRFLTAQRDDLNQAMESLRETIRRINRSSRERFVEAFEAIRVSYQEIFKSLFNGGRADLKLEEGEDVLECGIEILAQPPGKRLTSVSLMSGGEKAMSAIALLFAIFRFQPSPFCLLDEVDAALDDVNVGRFTRMLREYAGSTQFVLITHNKRSMESANVLYGVTMEEPGVSKLVSLQLS
ncbi:MAG TPA: chromosome segregation protein SMC [Candidatus Polarisedimenticolaceae bacterium]|nr:chromosome segregation protein SMC [Candidatus Polarisedimenticolaceae bacterium]